MKSFKEFLESIVQEKRKEHTKNVSAAPRPNTGGTYHEIALRKLMSIDPDQLDHYGVTMTNIPKVGLNPGSNYDTPNGVYFYPAKYYIEVKKENNELPFADYAPYINIIKLNTEKILRLDRYTESNFREDIRYLKKSWFTSLQYIDVPGDTDSYIDDLVRMSKTKARVHTTAGRLWYVLYKISNMVGDADEYGDSRNIWSRLLLELGYEAVLDYGAGIIHENEPTQGMVVATTKVSLVDRYVRNAKKTLSVQSRRDLSPHEAYYKLQELFNKEELDSKTRKYLEKIIARSGLQSAKYGCELNIEFPLGEPRMVYDVDKAGDYSSVGGWVRKYMLDVLHLDTQVKQDNWKQSIRNTEAYKKIKDRNAII